MCWKPRPRLKVPIRKGVVEAEAIEAKGSDADSEGERLVMAKEAGCGVYKASGCGAKQDGCGEDGYCLDAVDAAAVAGRVVEDAREGGLGARPPAADSAGCGGGRRLTVADGGFVGEPTELKLDVGIEINADVAVLSCFSSSLFTSCR